MASFLISQTALERNARLLRDIAEASGAHLLLALKAFATTGCFPCLRPYLDGCCASGLYEATLAARHMGGHIAVYSPAYQPEELERLLLFAHHIDFNSIPQWQRYRNYCLKHPRVQSGELQLGLRINPCFSTGHTALYDPCIPGSRLGIPEAGLAGVDLTGISGLHFHTLCEQGAAELIDTFRAVEKGFGSLLSSPRIRYLNMGGGHWITKPDYDRDALVRLIREVRSCYNLEVFLEPGEAWCVHTGVLRAKVLDVFESLGYSHAILDVSASAHMPDVLEMPYRPDVFAIRPQTFPATEGKDPLKPAVRLPGESYEQAGEAGQKPYTYRLGAPTCLAGDVLGDYSFAAPLTVGDEIIFDDMSHYTIVKTTHFNGVPHPKIQFLLKDGSIQTLANLGYGEFEQRLG